MPTPLTDLERRVLDYLVEYLRLNTYQPSIREIGREFSIRSTKTVSELLQSLADKGWIERDPSRSRGVRLLGLDASPDTVSVPLLDGTGRAHPLVLDRRLVGATGVFVYPLTSDHLAAHGLRAGDLLLLEPVLPAAIETGDLLLTRTDQELELRRCTATVGGLALEPLPGEVEPTVLTARQAQHAVQGRVAGLVRRLRPVEPGGLAEPIEISA